MPIGGFVLHVQPERREDVLEEISRFPDLTVYGYDDKGQVVIVLESETSEEMEKRVDSLLSIEGVITCDLAYLHGEDEVEKIERGEYVPKIRFGRKPES
ncbi:MAG: chaperone NapD [Thermodesulfobacteria bacterium]|nr:chaperone NapD [Thermodesulfobacteriota bacterium]